MIRKLVIHKLNFFLLFFSWSFFCFSQNNSLAQIQQKAKNALKNEQKDSAFYYDQLLLKEAEKQDSAEYKHNAYVQLGDLYYKQNKKDEALKNYYNALRIAKETKDLLKQARVLNVIAGFYYEEKSNAEALRLYREELVCRQKIGDSIILTHTYLNLSTVFRKFKEFDSAVAMLNKAKTITAKKRDKKLPAYLYEAIAAYYFSLYTKVEPIVSYRDSAEVNWKKAYKLWKSIGLPDNAIQPLFNLGYVYYTKQDYKQALENYLQVKSIIDSLNIPSKKITLYGNLGELYYDMGNFKEAADLFRAVHEINDSLQKDELKKYAIKTEKQYQLENKDKTILEQKLELSQNQKQIYFYILLFITALVIAIAIFIYFAFKRNVSKKVNEAKEKFFSNVMHEVRTPLSMIQAPLKTLRPKINDEEGKYYLDLAERNINRLNELINQMLDVSKIESAAYKLSPSVGNLDLFFSELVFNFEKLALEKNINFISSIQLTTSVLVYDKDALEKLVSNLLSNAIKYTAANGTVGITVCAEDAQEKVKLSIDVWDTGIGIAKNEQVKIFDRFFRSDRSSSKVAGVGIGLSLVKDLVAAFKGKIEFTSEEKKGTTFHVELLLNHPEVTPTEQLEAYSKEDKPLVLLVEDDTDIIEFLSTFLISRNYSVIKAQNGIAANALLLNMSPDMIITDLMMEGMDGLTFVKQVRSNKGLDHIPIIVLSAKASGQTRVEVLNAGAHAFIAKPFLPEELFSVISNQIELLAHQKNELQKNIQSQKPDLKAEDKFSSIEPYTQKLFDLIFKHLDNSELSVELLADLMATNRSHFQRKIKKLTGYSPSELIKLVRLQKAKEFLLAKKGNITEVSDLCGFSSQSYFTKCFSQHFGYSPTQIFDHHELPKG